MASEPKSGSHAKASDDTQRTGFFDLPREIRDVIYEYSVTSMRDSRWSGHKKSMDMDWSANCHCHENTLAVIRPRPPYFAHHSESCLVPDRFLYSTSLVSKQFATELRPFFFRNTAFQVDSMPINSQILREPFGGPLLEHYFEFVHALGAEAKDIRRMLIGVTTEMVMQGAGEPDLRPEDAVRELEPVRGLLHRDVIILLALKVYNGDALTIECFDCKRSDDGTSFVARKLEDRDEWEEYLARL
jgi:hypothetical protein